MAFENDPVMQAVLNAAPTNARYPFIGGGRHELEVVSIKQQESKKDIQVRNLMVTFIVVKTDGVSHQVGDKVTGRFQLTGHRLPQYQADAHGAVNTFQRELLKSFFPNPSTTLELAEFGKACAALQFEQSGRGLRIRAEGRTVAQKADKSKTFTYVDYFGIPGQTEATRQANCARQDAGVLPGPPAVSAAPVGGYLSSLDDDSQDSTLPYPIPPGTKLF